ncbi:MAG: AlkA N-terminal domain-containing protein [Acidobacteriaceae bacterium]
MQLERESMRFSLRPVPPFRLDWTVWALRRRAMNAVDRWDGSTYQRGITLDGNAALIAVTQHQGMLEVVVTGMHLPASARQSATDTIERLLGIRVNLSRFYEFSKTNPRLHQLATQFRGMKPPRFATVFEAWSTESLASNSA